jgi:hypothetical protein
MGVLDKLLSFILSLLIVEFTSAEEMSTFPCRKLGTTESPPGHSDEVKNSRLCRAENPTATSDLS